LTSPRKPFSDHSAARWLGEEPPEIEFTIDHIVPTGMVTLLIAEGGAGKSLLMQNSGTVIPNGLPFLGLGVAAGNVAGIFAEDVDPVLHHRQARLNNAHDIDMESLATRFFPMTLAGQDAILFDDDGSTALLREIEEELKDIEELRLLLIDNVALVFAGNENDRIQVTQFLNALNGLAQRLNIGIMLSTHVSKSTDGSPLRAASGSTAFINACRSVLVLHAERSEEGACLELIKSNHERPGLKISLIWEDGVLRSKTEHKGAVASIDRNNVRKALVEALGMAVAKGMEPSYSIAARNLYAPKLVKNLYPDIVNGYTIKELERALGECIAGDEILIKTVGRSGREKRIVVPAVPNKSGVRRHG
jgi:hypothetical protein